MKFLKKINNNFALAEDEKGRRVIVGGKGIGFGRFPSVVTDMHLIEHIYYNIANEKFITLIQELPEELIEICNIAVDEAKEKLQRDLKSSLVFVLADHLNDAIRRHKEGIRMNYGILYQVKYKHAQEMQLAYELVKKINQLYGVELFKEEASVIAMDIVEAGEYDSASTVSKEEILLRILLIVSETLKIEINRKDISYYKFAAYVQELLEENREIRTENVKLYPWAAELYPTAAACARKICDYLVEVAQVNPEEEAEFGLILHINWMKAAKIR